MAGGFNLAGMVERQIRRRKQEEVEGWRWTAALESRRADRWRRRALWLAVALSVAVLLLVKSWV